MTALQHPRVRRWLGNFDGADRPTAELLVGSLAFIGAEDVRAGLIALVQRLLLSLKGPTAVFPARETSPGEAAHGGGRDGDYVVFNDPSSPGSEAVVANIVTATRRIPKFKLRLTTGLDLPALRKERARSILVVDDFSGSGQRLLEFGEALRRHPTIRSWRSYHLLDIHIAVYTATKAALETLRESYGERNVHFAQPCPTFLNAGWSDEQLADVEELCKKYGRAKRRMALGFKQSRALAVLPWTAPNNLPFILWNSRPEWHSLFEGKVVPADLLDLFGRRSSGRLDPTDFSGGAATRLGHVLDAIQLRIKKVGDIAEAKNISFAEVERLLATGRNLGLIGATGRLTERGLVEWRRRAPERRQMDLPNRNKDYYPSQLRVRR